MGQADDACLWYAVAAYERLCGFIGDDLYEIAIACSEFSLLEPLGEIHDKRYSLPYIEGNLTGLQVIAYMSVATDILSGYQISDGGMSFIPSCIQDETNI